MVIELQGRETMSDGLILSTIAVIFIILLAIAVAVSIDSSKKTEIRSAECEKVGGVLLDRTYNYGKNQTGHNYTCIDKRVVKDI